MQRLWNLNWENITYDHDISGLMRGLIDWGVIEGGTVVGNKLQPVQAIVPLVRSNGQKILAFFESDEVIDLPTIGDYKVYIEVDQSKIDFWGNNTEDGTGIASIKTWPTLPSQNFLLLASVTAGVVKDERNLIPKVGQIAQRTTTLESKLQTQEQRVERLEYWGSDHLEEDIVVGEVFSVGDQVMEHNLPNIANCNIPIDIWHKEKGEVHIQRIANGKESNQLKLKFKNYNWCATKLIVEVRRGIKVEVGASEIYRYWGEVIAASEIPADAIPFDNQRHECTVTTDRTFRGNRWEFLSVVVYMEKVDPNSISHYYIAWDNSQYSEAFSCTFVAGENRTRSKLEAYCNSDAFGNKCLVKIKNQKYKSGKSLPLSFNNWGYKVENWSYYSQTYNSTIQFPAYWEYEYKISGEATDDYGRWLKCSINFDWNYSTQTEGGLGYTVLGIKDIRKDQAGITISSPNRLRSYGIDFKFSSLSIPEFLWKKVYPRRRGGIGEFVPCTTFGRHIDWGWVAG